MQKTCSWKFRKIQKNALVFEYLINKDVGLRLTLLLKKALRRRCFPGNYANFLRPPFFNGTPAEGASKNWSLPFIEVYIESENAKKSKKIINDSFGLFFIINPPFSAPKSVNRLFP